MRRLPLPAWFCFLICVQLRSSAVPSLSAADWVSWRGPKQNGVAPEQGLPEKFDIAGMTDVVWKAPYGCRSTPLVLNGRVYFNTRFGEKETEQEGVVCLDVKTGKLVWDHKFNVFFADIVSARVGWTNIAADRETGNIYVHGTQGLFLCFNKDGKLLWQRSLTEEFGRVSGYGGRLASPIVDEDKVIIGMACAAWGEYGRGGCRFLAFDKKTGNIIWWGSTFMRVKDTFQSTPVVAVINEERLMISGGADGAVHAFKVRTGERVWSYLFAEGAINVSPVVEGNKVYIAHGDINPDVAEQGRVLCLDASKVKDGKPALVWKKDGPKIKFSSPVVHDGRLYMVDEGAALYCFEAETGNKIYEFKYGQGSNVRCSPVLADGKMYVGDASGRFYVLDPVKKKRLHREYIQSLAAGVDSELDGAAAVANGCVLFASNDQIFCIGKGGVKAAEEVPGIKEPAGDPKAKAVCLQVYPADVTLRPGESVTFTAKLYDDKGRFLRETEAKWELGPMLAPEPTPGLPPPPKINPPPLKGDLGVNGKLTVPAGVQGQFGTMIATADGLTGRARVRQVPKVPYAQDFENIPVGAVPGGWVNAIAKFAVREVGGAKVLVKTATNPSPLVARANAFFGSPDMSDYTIECDVMGQKIGSNLPDMAVVNSRYSFGLFGNTQQLRLISWDALPRIDKSIAFAWKHDTWYRLKLQVTFVSGKGVARGKVWERGQAEPENWIIEVTDPVPNREGAPAVYALATGFVPGKNGAEVYFDNVIVTPNRNGKQGRR